MRPCGYAGPTIAVTGNATAVGITSTTGKPFGPAELRATLEAAADKFRGREAPAAVAHV